MIAHISIGVSDLDKSKRFYDSALAPLGYRCLRPGRTMLGYGYGRDSIALWIISAERPVRADEKSGLHVCFMAPNAEAVDALHAAALRAGGQDNGAPGLRPICAPIITPPLSSIRMDTGSRRITAQPKLSVNYHRADPLSLTGRGGPPVVHRSNLGPSLQSRFDAPVGHEPDKRNKDIEGNRYPWLKKRERNGRRVDCE